MSALRSVDVLALSILSENSQDGTIGFLDAVRAITVEGVEPDLMASAVIERLAIAGQVSFDLNTVTLSLTPAGCDTLVLFETRTILMLAESEGEEV